MFGAHELMTVQRQSGSVHSSVVGIPECVRNTADRLAWEEMMMPSFMKKDRGRLTCKLCEGRRRGGSQHRAHHARLLAHIKKHLQESQLIMQRRTVLLECFCKSGQSVKHFHCPDCNIDIVEHDLTSHLQQTHGLISHQYGSYWEKRRARILAMRDAATPEIKK